MNCPRLLRGCNQVVVLSQTLNENNQHKWPVNVWTHSSDPFGPLDIAKIKQKHEQSLTGILDRINMLNQAAQTGIKYENTLRKSHVELLLGTRSSKVALNWLQSSVYQQKKVPHWPIITFLVCYQHTLHTHDKFHCLKHSHLLEGHSGFSPV